MVAKPELTQIEKDKLGIDPNFDFRDIAQRPFHDITTNEIGMFKWSGVYHQLQQGFFMIRLRLPGGIMTSDQLIRAANLVDAYGQGLLCITTRQTLQFHWIRKEDIYKVIEGIEEVGISTKNACGDDTRNVVTCPLQGVCPHEIGDIRSILMAIADDPELLDDQRNLPKKHKISVAGCHRGCGQTLINCQGWHPVFREETNERGWKFYAGGGLGARPYLAKPIFDWVPEVLVLDVVRASTEAYRRLGNRRVRAYARLKVVVDELGQEKYGEIVLGIMKERDVQGLEKIEKGKGLPNIGESFLDGQSVIPQRQKGFSTVRVIIERSEFSGEDARKFAQWAEEFGDSTIMFTNRQNLHLRFVPDDKVPLLVQKINTSGFATEGHERLSDVVACVGTTMCNLAVSDTPNTYRHIIDELAKDKKLMEQVGQLRINMNGCPNSCTQHWVADIGLRGLRKRDDVGSEDGFSIYVGGSLEGEGYIADYVCDVLSPEVVPAIQRMLFSYLENRSDSRQTFGQFTRLIGGGRLAEMMGASPCCSRENDSSDALSSESFHRVLYSN